MIRLRLQVLVPLRVLSICVACVTPSGFAFYDARNSNSVYRMEHLSSTSEHQNTVLPFVLPRVYA